MDGEIMPRNLLWLMLAVPWTAGCVVEQTQRPLPVSHYSEPLAEGHSALHLVVDPSRMPDLASACAGGDHGLVEAVDRSLSWFAAPSSRAYFPFEGITHRQAEASLGALRQLLDSGLGASSLATEMERLFDVYESVGYNGEGVVLYTGYYAPIFDASRTRSGRFRYPLYKRPPDLATNPATGDPQGRRLADGRVVPYPTRQEIEEQDLLAGHELVWLADPLSTYICHVNGSAKLRLADSNPPTFLYVGYAGKTDRPYASLGRAMVEAGLLPEGEVSLAGVRRVFERDPERVVELMHRNESYVFFDTYDGSRWPAGSLGVPVTSLRTLATDKDVYPRGGLVLVDTHAVTTGRGSRDFLQLMLDQDTGGAIRAPGRADIFMGIGPEAEVLAGGQYAEGRLYYLFLKPEHVETYARP
jgi:membrane-bound lytic murein transglycosylase A